MSDYTFNGCADSVTTIGGPALQMRRAGNYLVLAWSSAGASGWQGAYQIHRTDAKTAPVPSDLGECIISGPFKSEAEAVGAAFKAGFGTLQQINPVDNAQPSA